MVNKFHLLLEKFAPFNVKNKEIVNETRYSRCVKCSNSVENANHKFSSTSGPNFVEQRE